MSKVQSLLESLSQFTQSGNLFRTAGKTVGILESGVYNIGADMRGIYFDKVEIKTDALIKINTSKYNYITEEIDKFWETKAKFDELGFTNKRAFIMHSKPGMGKSCLVKQLIEDMTKKENTTFLATDLGLLAAAIREFREVEPDRKCLVVLEELDEMLYSGSKQLSDLLDGPTSVGSVFYFATTNYIDRIPERMKRPSRFDRIVEMGAPSREDRLEYFKNKLGMNEHGARIEEFAAKTDGYSFAHLKEFLVSVCCLGNSVEETIRRLDGMVAESVETDTLKYGQMDEAEFCLEFQKLLKEKAAVINASSEPTKSSEFLKLFD